MTNKRFGEVGTALDALYYSIDEAKDAVKELRRLALPTATSTLERLDAVEHWLTAAQEEFLETEPCDDAFDDELDETE